MKNNWSIKDYQLIQETRKNNWPYMLVLFLVTIGILIILYKFNFQIYETETLVKNDQDFLLIVDSSKINEIEKNSYIYINQNKYLYDIIEIDKDYSNINDNIYQTVHINIHNYKTDAIITECHFLKESKSIYQMIIEFIEGGVK